jgi:type IV pilus modification protein PilV
MPTPCSRTQGFTLIECLVALCILSFGIMASVGLQLHALRASQQAHNQHIALRFAAELIEIIRLHPHVVAQSNHPLLFDITAHTLSADAMDQVCTLSTPCNAWQSAQSLIAQWQQRLSAALPNVHAVVCRDHTPWHSHEQQFAWACDDTPRTNLVLKMGWSSPSQHPTLSAHRVDTAPQVVMQIDVTLP